MSTAAAVDRALAGILVDCATGEKSGIVSTARGRLKRLFCLEEGRLVWVASNLIEEQVAEALVAAELLPVGELIAARKKAGERDAKISRFLVDEELVAEEALRGALENHFKELLHDTLNWTDGMSMFTAGRPDLSGELTVELPCVPLLLDYACRHPEKLDDVRIRIGPPGTRPKLDEERAGALEGLGEDATRRFLLDSCDGSLKVQDLAAAGPESEEVTLRAIYGLSLLGVLAPDTRKEAATPSDVVTREEVRARLLRIEGANCYAVLELGGACTAEQVRDAYYFLARRYHPDRFRSGPLADLIEPIEAFFTKVTEAYNTLVDPERRAEYDEQLAKATGPVKTSADHDAKELARQNYLHARALIGRGRYTDAVGSFQNAIKLDSREPKYRIEIGRLMSRNPRMRAEAEEHLQEAARLDPAQVDSYMALGELYEKMDRTEEARAQFHEVLRWEPDHVAAAAHLKSLD